MRNAIVPIAIYILVGCSESDPEYASSGRLETLRKELAGLNISAPEEDAARDIRDAQPKCYSINGYSRFFPGVTTEEEASYCLAIEVNFAGTSDVMNELVRQATEYATRYNEYVLAHTAAPP
jgi:hypothetical protein